LLYRALGKRSLFLKDTIALYFGKITLQKISQESTKNHKKVVYGAG
jgi:hypothetical protein